MILLPLIRFSQGHEYSPHRLLRRTLISLDRYKMIIRVELNMDKFKSSTCKSSFILTRSIFISTLVVKFKDVHQLVTSDTDGYTS